MRQRITSLGVALEANRYPIHLPLRYFAAAGESIQGCGRTLAISSGGVRFTGDQDLPVGLNVRLVIAWPEKLADGVSLSLSIMGKIEESARSEFEVAIHRHEFRTRRGERTEE